MADEAVARRSASIIRRAADARAAAATGAAVVCRRSAPPGSGGAGTAQRSLGRLRARTDGRPFRARALNRRAAPRMPRTEPMMPRPSRPVEARRSRRFAKCVPRPRRRRHRRCPSARRCLRRPEPCRDGAAARGSVSTPPEATRVAPPVAPEPPPARAPPIAASRRHAPVAAEPEDRLRQSRRRDGLAARPSEDSFVRSAQPPRRVLFFATLLPPDRWPMPAWAQDISINLGARAMAASPSARSS